MDQATIPGEGDRTGSRSIVRGLTLEDRDRESRISDSWYQDGLEDGRRGLYDRHSFHRDHPLRAEERALARLEHDLAAAASHQLEDEATALGIVEEARADVLRASKTLSLARQRHSRATAAADTALARLTDRDSPDYVPDARTRTVPGSSTKGARSGWRWEPWVIGAAVVSEAALSYWASMILGEDLLGTIGLALVLTLVTVVVPIFAGRNLRGPGSMRSKPKIASLISLAVLIAVVIGSGWMRFVDAAPAVAQTLSAAPQSSDGKVRPTGAGGHAQLDPGSSTILFVLCVALPLAVAAMVLLVELADRSASIAEARTARAELANSEEVLADLEAQALLAQQTAASSEHNFEIVVERTKDRIRGLPALAEANYLSYISGLAHAMADPAITALLDDCAAAFHERLARAAEKLVEEYLDLVRGPQAMPAPLHISIDDSGRAVVPTNGAGHA
jgi:hypothetical protein